MLSKRIYVVLACLFVFVTNTLANVNVTSGGSLNLCVGTAYTTIGNITIAESAATEFSISGNVQIYEINAPSNFEFNPGNGSVTATGADITFSALTVTATKVTLIYFINATATTDKFVLSNIQIRANNPSGSQNLVRSGNAIQTGNNPGDNKVHAVVTSAGAYVDLNASSKIVCANGSDINLNGSPNGGSYSVSPASSGLTGNIFKPSQAGAGSYVITYAATNNGCPGTDTVHILVKPIPSVTFFGLATEYCSGDADASLTGFPAGGAFSGSGIVNTSFFRPSNAGVGNNKSVTYTYSSNGCQGSSTLQTNVKQSPTLVSISLIPSKSNYFTQDDSIIVSGSQNINIPSDGSVYVSGNGVVKGSDNLYRFFPNVVGQGSYNISRTVISSSNNCSTSKDTTITVSPSSGGVISGLGETYCISSGNVNMTVSNDIGQYSISYLYESPYFSIYLPYANSSNVIQDTDHNNGFGIFKPSLLSIGKYRIEFAGETKGTIYAFVEILESPTITVNIGTSYCSSDPEITIDYISSIPGNVVFSGKRVDDGKFDPGRLAAFGNDTIFYEYTQVSNGCASSGFVITKVNPTPTNVFFTGLQSDKIYCDGDADSKLEPNPLITPSGGLGKFVSTDGILKIGAATYFSSSIAVKSNTSNSEFYDIDYIYTSAEGCSQSYSETVQVNKLPSVGLGGLNSEYCFGATSVSMTGFPNGGTYTISSLPSNPIAAGTLSGNTFNPKVATPSTYYIKYQYTDNTNAKCTNSSIDTVIVHKLPSVNFTGLNEKYCEKDFPSVLKGSNPDEPGTTYTFSSIPSGAVAGNSFYPQNLGVGKYYVTYFYTDANHCSNSVKDSTVVFGQPISSFNLSTVCEDDLIELRDSLTVLNAGVGVSFSQINKWIWDIDNKIFNRENLDTSLSAGNYIIKYTTITDQGCQNTQSKAITIGSYPQINFTWDEICNQQNTQFKNLSSIVVGSIDTLRWDFSGGMSSGNIIRPAVANPTFGNINHKFSGPGIYEVSLEAVSNYKCKAKLSQNVYILPAKVPGPNTPYANDFQADGGGWISSSVSDTVSTWIWGQPSKSVIKTTTNKAWVTGLTGYNKPLEQSYVYSPCFSMDSLVRPMITLDIWNATLDKLNGGALQYSYDGKVWETLGKNEKGVGINWYDDFGIAGNPGEQSVGQYGWSYMDSVGFKNARYTLDEVLTASKNIRFRVAFGSTQNVSDGLAFDNIWIGERTKMLLIEQFTNNAYPVTKVENEMFYSKINEYPLDVVGLQYHVGYSLPDPFYNRNTADPGARSLFNGVSVIPYAVVNGSESAGHPATVLRDTTIIKAILKDPGFKINIDPIFTPSSASITGTVNITANVPVSNPVTLYISVLERYVSNVVGINTETNYQWVHAKFLPDAAGTGFSTTWAKNTSATIPFSCDYSTAGIYDPNKLAIIAFVQDNVTKEIYQAAYKGLGATVTTGVFDPLESTSTVTMYPNPANDITTVILNGKLAGEYDWVIFDELGRVVDQGLLSDGAEDFTVNTQNYADGFYTLRLSNAASGMKTLKFVVMH